MKKKLLLGVVALAITVTVIGGGFNLLNIDPPSGTLLLSFFGL